MSGEKQPIVLVQKNKSNRKNKKKADSVSNPNTENTAADNGQVVSQPQSRRPLPNIPIHKGFDEFKEQIKSYKYNNIESHLQLNPQLKYNVVLLNKHAMSKIDDKYGIEPYTVCLLREENDQLKYIYNDTEKTVNYTQFTKKYPVELTQSSWSALNREFDLIDNAKTAVIKPIFAENSQPQRVNLQSGAVKVELPVFKEIFEKTQSSNCPLPYYKKDVLDVYINQLNILETYNSYVRNDDLLCKLTELRTQFGSETVLRNHENKPDSPVYTRLDNFITTTIDSEKNEEEKALYEFINQVQKYKEKLKFDEKKWENNEEYRKHFQCVEGIIAAYQAFIAGDNARKKDFFLPELIRLRREVGFEQKELRKILNDFIDIVTPEKQKRLLNLINEIENNYEEKVIINGGRHVDSQRPEQAKGIINAALDAWKKGQGADSPQLLGKIYRYESEISRQSELIPVLGKEGKKTFKSDLYRIANNFANQNIPADSTVQDLRQLLHDLNIYEKENAWFGMAIPEVKGVRMVVDRYLIAGEIKNYRELLLELVDCRTKAINNTEVYEILSKYLNKAAGNDDDLIKGFEYSRKLDDYERESSAFFRRRNSDRVEQLRYMRDMQKNHLSRNTQATRDSLFRMSDQIIQKIRSDGDESTSVFSALLQTSVYFEHERMKSQKEFIDILSSEKPSIKGTMYEKLVDSNDKVKTKENFQSFLGKTCSTELSAGIIEHLEKVRSAKKPVEEEASVDKPAEEMALTKVVSNIIECYVGDLSDHEAARIQAGNLYKNKIFPQIQDEKNFRVASDNFGNIVDKESPLTIQLLRGYIQAGIDELIHISNGKKDILRFIPFLEMVIKKLGEKAVYREEKTDVSIYYSYKLCEYLKDKNLSFLHNFFTESKYANARAKDLFDVYAIQEMQKNATQTLVLEIINKLGMPLDEHKQGLREIDSTIKVLEDVALGNNGKFNNFVIGLEDVTKIKDAMKRKIVDHLQLLLKKENTKEFEELIAEIEKDPNFVLAKLISENLGFISDDFKTQFKDIAKEALDIFLLESKEGFEIKGKASVKAKLASGKYSDVNEWLKAGYVIEVSGTKYCEKIAIETAIIEFVDHENKISDEKFLEIVENFLYLREKLANTYDSEKYYLLDGELSDGKPTSEKLNSIRLRFSNQRKLFTAEKNVLLENKMKLYELRSRRDVVIGLFSKLLGGIESTILNGEWKSALSTVIQGINEFLALQEPAEEIKNEAQRMMLDSCRALNKQIKSFEGKFDSSNIFQAEKTACKAIIQVFAAKNIPGSQVFLAYYEFMEVLVNKTKWNDDAKSLENKIEILNQLEEVEKNSLKQKLQSVFVILGENIATSKISPIFLCTSVKLGKTLDVSTETILKQSLEILQNALINKDNRLLVAFENALIIIAASNDQEVSKQSRNYLDKLYEQYIDALMTNQDNSKLKFFIAIIETTAGISEQYPRAFRELLELLINEKEWSSVDKQNFDGSKYTDMLDKLSPEQKLLANNALAYRYEKLLNLNIAPSSTAQQFIVSLNQKLTGNLLVRAIEIITQEMPGNINQFENALIFVSASKNQKNLEICKNRLSDFYGQYVKTLIHSPNDKIAFENISQFIKIMELRLPSEYQTDFCGKKFLTYINLLELLSNDEKWKNVSNEKSENFTNVINDFSLEQQANVKNALKNRHERLLYRNTTETISPSEHQFIAALNDTLKFDLLDHANSLIASSLASAIEAHIFKNALKFIVEANNPEKLKICMAHLDKLYVLYVKALFQKDDKKITYLKELIDITTQLLPQQYPQGFCELLELLSNDAKWNVVTDSNLKMDALTLSEAQKDIVTEALKHCYGKLLDINQERSLSPSKAKFIVSLTDKLKIKADLLKLAGEVVVNAEGYHIARFENALAIIVEANDKDKLQICKKRLVKLYDQLHSEYFELWNQFEKKDNTREIQWSVSALKQRFEGGGQPEKINKIEVINQPENPDKIKRIQVLINSIEQKLPLAYVDKTCSSLEIFALLMNDERWNQSNGFDFYPEKYSNIIKSGFQVAQTLTMKKALIDRCEKILNIKQPAEISSSAANLLVSLNRVLDVKLLDSANKKLAVVPETGDQLRAFKNALTLIAEANDPFTLNTSMDHLDKLYGQYAKSLIEKKKGDGKFETLKAAIDSVTQKMPTKYSKIFIDLLEQLYDDEAWKNKDANQPFVGVNILPSSQMDMLKAALNYRYHKLLGTENISEQDRIFVVSLSKELNVNLWSQAQEIIASHESTVTQFENALIFIVEAQNNEVLLEESKKHLQNLCAQYFELVSKPRSQRDAVEFNNIKALVEMVEKKFPQLYEGLNYSELFEFLQNEHFNWNNPFLVVGSEKFASVVNNLGMLSNDQQSIMRNKLQELYKNILSGNLSHSMSTTAAKLLISVAHSLNFDLITEATKVLDALPEAEDELIKIKNIQIEKIKLENALRIIVQSNNAAAHKRCGEILLKMYFLEKELASKIKKDDTVSLKSEKRKIDSLIGIMLSIFPDVDAEKVINYDGLISFLSAEDSLLYNNEWIKDMDPLQELRFKISEHSDTDENVFSKFSAALKRFDETEKRTLRKLLYFQYGILADKGLIGSMPLAIKQFMKLLEEGLETSIVSAELYNLLHDVEKWDSAASDSNYLNVKKIISGIAAVSQDEDIEELLAGCYSRVLSAGYPQVVSDSAGNFLASLAKELNIEADLFKRASEIVVNLTLLVSEDYQKINEIQFKNALIILKETGKADGFEKCADCLDALSVFLKIVSPEKDKDKFEFVCKMMQDITRILPTTYQYRTGEQSKAFRNLYALLHDDTAWGNKANPLQKLGFISENAEADFSQFLEQFDDTKKEMLKKALQTRHKKLLENYQKARIGKETRPEPVGGKTPYIFADDQVMSPEAWRFMGLLNKNLDAKLDDSNIVYRAMNGIRKLTSLEKIRDVSEEKLQKWFKNALAVVVANGDPAHLSECKLRLQGLLYRFSKLDQEDSINSARLSRYIKVMNEALPKSSDDNVEKDFEILENASKYLTEFEKSSEAISEIVSSCHNIEKLEKNKIRKQLYLWRHCVLEGKEFNPQIPDYIRKLYKPLMDALKEYQQNNEVSFNERLRILSEKMKKECDFIHAVRLNADAKLNFSVMESALDILKNSSSDRTALNHIHNVIVWLKTDSTDSKYKFKGAERLLNFYDQLADDLDVDMFANMVQSFSLSGIIESGFHNEKGLEVFYLGAIFGTTREDESIKGVLGTDNEREIEIHFNMIRKTISMQNEQPQNSLVIASPESLGEYDQVLREILLCDRLERIKKCADALKESSGEIEIFEALKKHIVSLQGNKEKEVSQILLDLMRRLNEKLDSDFQFRNEGKITLKNEIQKFIMIHKDIAQCYLETIMDECVGQSIKDVLGTEDKKKIGEHFDFVARLILMPGNEKFKKELREMRASGLYEYGEKLQEMTLPCASNVNVCLNALLKAPGDLNEFGRLGRYVKFLEQGKVKEVGEALLVFMDDLDNDIGGNFSNGDEICLKSKMEELIEGNAILRAFYVNAFASKTVLDSNIGGVLKNINGYNQHDQTVKHFNFVAKLLIKYPENKELMMKLQSELNTQTLGKYGERLAKTMVAMQKPKTQKINVQPVHHAMIFSK